MQTSTQYSAHRTSLLIIISFLAGVCTIPSVNYLMFNNNQQVFNETSAYHTLFEQAEQYRSKKKYNKAAELYTEALQHLPNYKALHQGLGNTLLHLHKPAAALKHLQHALSLDPRDPKTSFLCGTAYKHCNQTEKAIDCFTTVLKHAPQTTTAHSKLCHLYMSTHQLNKALEHALTACKLDSTDPLNTLNLGHVYNKQGNLQAAIEQYKKAVAQAPHLANAHYNLGYALKIKGDLDQALISLRKAEKLKPDHIDTHIALAQVHIAQGNYTQGWAEYEWRWLNHGLPLDYVRKQNWDGSAIAGKTILLYAEQGLGDTIQFIRYAQLLKQQGARVIARVQSPLIDLLSLCPYIDTVVCKGEQPHYDTRVSVMSLPHHMKTTIETVPASIPYLYAQPELVNLWKQRLKNDTNFKVGLCWNVDPIHEETKLPSALRSIPLAALKPLSSLKGVSFYSLQKNTDPTLSTHNPAGITLQTFGNDFDETHGRFMDTAAVIENLDLIISVDTCIAHLAGALGKPVWMILPFSPDCRWHLDRSDSPWYPTMKLFRPDTPLDWRSIGRMVAEQIKVSIDK